MDLSDEELVELAQQGSRPAFASIINRHRASVFNMALRIVGNREDAEEAAQDAFIRAFRALASFRQEAKFSTWLYRIAVNVSLTKARQSRLDVTSIDATMDDEDSAPLQIPDRALKPDEHIEQSQFQEQVRTMIAGLPPKYSAVITMYHIQSLSYDEIADICGLTKSHVGVILKRAKASVLEGNSDE